MQLIMLYSCAAKLLALAAVVSTASAENTSCPGYTAQNVSQTSTSLTARLTLAGPACNMYGTDLDDLILNVEYQTGKWGMRWCFECYELI